MERRSWLWRRKSIDKSSPGETESSLSASSDRHSDEQEGLRISSVNSPNNAHSPEVSLKDVNHEVEETIQILNEKLSAALLNINAKEELVKQHGRLAEEAVLGWENAEKEVTSLKRQLEAASKKSSFLEDRVVHLNAALKECLSQLRLTRDEQEQKVHDAVIQKTHEWESVKMDLEIKLIELQAKAEISTSLDRELHLKIESLEKEKILLEEEVTTLQKDLQMQILDLELSARTAETASKQHLDSIKKVAKLEVECRRLLAAARKSSLTDEQKLITNSHYAESVTDSQSNAGELLLSLDNEQSCSDSWTSTLMAELDMSKNEKVNMRNLTTSNEIELMDDFLEMEKLAGLPDSDRRNSYIAHADSLDTTVNADCSSRKEYVTVCAHKPELKEMVETMPCEKVSMQMSLDEMNWLKNSRDQLVAAEDKLAELQRHVNLVNGEKYAFEMELEAAEEKKNELEMQLASAYSKNANLHERISILESKFQEEQQLSAAIKARCEHTEAMEAKLKKMELELESAYCEIAELKAKVGLLEGKVAEEKSLSSELASRCQKMEVLKEKKEGAEGQLESANLELHILREKVDSLEMKLQEEKVFSTELLTKCKAMVDMDAKRKELECQVRAKDLEVSALQVKANTLEEKLKEERARSSELAANIEMKESKRIESVVQLELAQVEVGCLQEKLLALEKQIEEKTTSTKLATKYHNLEHEISNKLNETKFHSFASSERVLNIRQVSLHYATKSILDITSFEVEENSVAARKLAECQRTIASLDQQLKTLANFDAFMLQSMKAGSYGDLLDLGMEPEFYYSRISPESLVLSSGMSNNKKIITP
ncbi:hypothetical protein ZIOFF_015591 [Zingiber officinale]|uniref:Filament-like plant protein 3 n=1 Tax=Zingiber officinale TaxID=94328 RepID=A0A8J5LTS4_ZINOF|nr:hypothetical protein ZIOFF_015591 [Zingiber officinale]